MTLSPLHLEFLLQAILATITTATYSVHFNLPLAFESLQPAQVL